MLLNFNLLDCHVRIHGRCLLHKRKREKELVLRNVVIFHVCTHLYCLSQCLVMIDWIAIGLNCYLLLHTCLNNAIAFGFVLFEE